MDQNITVKEFKLWIDTVEEFHEGEDEWYPSPQQWKKIRAKIDLLAGPDLEKHLLELKETVESIKDKLAEKQQSRLTHQPQPTTESLRLPESSLLEPQQPQQPHQPRLPVAPEVTLPPAVQLTPSTADGVEPGVKIATGYDQHGNYVSSFK